MHILDYRSYGRARKRISPPRPSKDPLTGWEREKRKATLGNNELLHDDIAGQAYVENFALKIFNNGAAVVESGKATGYKHHPVNIISDS